MAEKYSPRISVLAIMALAAICGLIFLWARNQISPGLFSGDARACSSPHNEQSTESLTVPSIDRSATDAAFNFLDAQMDKYHRSMIVYSRSGSFGAFYPSGKIGDIGDIDIDSQSRGGSRTPLKIEYRPTASSGLGWAGVYFLYPDGNWGQFPGRNLAGATKLSFWVCANRDTQAEFFVGGIKQSDLRYSDTLPKASTGIISVNSTWQRHEINLTGSDLSSVIGGFAVAASRERDPGPRSLFLDDVEFDLPSLNEPRFVESYAADDCAVGGLPDAAQVYDQALVMLAFLARGQPDDLRRADLIARALVKAQQSDRTFKDGRLRNAYASGELIDPHYNTTRLPGAFDPVAKKYFEDENAAGSDTGNMAWAALALVQAHALLPERAGHPYLNAALSLARWIVNNTRIDDQLGGFDAGVQGFERAAGDPDGQQRKNYRSTEHNIDLVALFNRLANVAGDETPDGRYWLEQAAHARSFVEKMQNEQAGAHYFWTGTGEGTTINKSVIPLDVQTWAVLHSREPVRYSGALDWALGHCEDKDSHDAFGFNCNGGDGIWWEGTAQVAAALRWLKRDQDATPVLTRLREAQLKDQTAAGAMPAASRCGLPTGFEMSFRSGKTMPWVYPNLPHIGATAWFVFAELGFNPYFSGHFSPKTRF